jgi:hypothetical protein
VKTLCVLFFKVLFSPEIYLFSQQHNNPFVTSPFIGEKLDRIEENYFHLFPTVTNFQEATFYLNPDSSLTFNLKYKQKDQKNTGSYAAWVAGGSLLTLSNGLYAGITFPLWMVAGIPATSGESFRDRYEADYPDEFYWNGVKIFSRFPQGIDGINLSELKPIIFNNE